MERKIKVDLHPRATSKNQSQIQDSKLGNGTYGIQQSSKFPSPFQHIAPSGKLTNLRNKWRVGNFNRKYSALQGSPISCNGNGKISDDFKRGLNHICIMHQHKSEIIPLLFTNWALQDAYWLKRARSPALHVHMPFLQGYQLQSSLTNSPTSAYMPYAQAIHTEIFFSDPFDICTKNCTDTTMGFCCEHWYKKETQYSMLTLSVGFATSLTMWR